VERKRVIREHAVRHDSILTHPHRTEFGIRTKTEGNLGSGMKWDLGEEIRKPMMVFTKSLDTAIRIEGQNSSDPVLGMVCKHLHSAC